MLASRAGTGVSACLAEEFNGRPAEFAKLYLNPFPSKDCLQFLDVMTNESFSPVVGKIP
jgi:hypothetical protein